MGQLEATVEDKWREAGNARVLRQMRDAGDINGLLDYALMLNHLYNGEKVKVRWAIQEAMNAPLPSADNYMGAAAELMQSLGLTP